MKLLLLFTLTMVLVALSQTEQESEVSLRRAAREANAQPQARKHKKEKNLRRKNHKNKDSKRRKNPKKKDKKRSKNPQNKDDKRRKNPKKKGDKRRKNPKNKADKRTNRGRKQRPQAREGRQDIVVKGETCQYIFLDDIMSNPGCTTGTKFVLKAGGNGVRKQFLILNGKIIQAWMRRGTKFARDCPTFTDITTSVKCTEVKGPAGEDGPAYDLASIVLGSTGSNASTTVASETSTTPTAETSTKTSAGITTTPSPCQTKSIGTNLVFLEDGKNFTQENTFNVDTGVLDLVVPAHGKYRKTQFVIHETGVLLKTAGACSISPVPENYNVLGHHNSFAKEMANRLQKSENRLEEQPKYHMLKIRQERVGHTDRLGNLNNAHSSACDDEPIVKTKDMIISEEDFKQGEAGKFIIVGKTPKSQRSKRQEQKSETLEACSIGGPDACGRGFTNPETQQSFSFHQISAGSICIWCCDVAPAPSAFCPPVNGKEICDCKKIVDKNSLLNCTLSNRPVENNIQTGNNNTTQTLTFNGKPDDSNPITVKVEMPAHTSKGRPLKDMTVIMNADSVGAWHPIYNSIKNNMMTKIGDDCLVMDLPSDMFPVDIALGLEEIKKPSVQEDDKDRHFLNRQLDDRNVTGLHPLVQQICPNGVKSTRPELISKEDSEMLGNGSVVIFEDNKIKKEVDSKLRLAGKRCSIEIKTATVEKASGCWRWPNPDGPELYVHGISTTVEELSCCIDNDEGGCCDDAGAAHCKCSQLKDKASFEACSVSGASWGAWGAWSACPGKTWSQKRSRECPFICKGSAVESRSCNTFLLPGEHQLAKNTLLTTLPALYKEYNVSFEFKATTFNTTDYYRNILHLSIGGNNGNYGDRTPMISVWDAAVQVSSSVNGSPNYYILHTSHFIIGKWMQMSVSQIKDVKGEYNYNIEMDGKLLHTVVNSGAQDFTNVSVYASDPWYEAQMGCIRNLVIRTSATSALCPPGYTYINGDVRGWGTISGQSSFPEQSITDCKGLCSSKYQCCSFEWSPTSRICNLNKECKPSENKFQDYRYCVQNRNY